MIIFDASTLILLARASVLELFISNAKTTAMMPEAVEKETCAAHREETPVITGLMEKGELTVKSVKNRKQIEKLMTDFCLDLGETEAIMLALKEEGGIVATDDRNAIRACKMLNISFITAISVLIGLHERGRILGDEVMLKLDKLASIGRYSKAIVADARLKIKGEQ
jgi:hypothetical protein